jgi:Holliday junction resolvase
MKEGDLVKAIISHYKNRDNIKLFRVHSGKVQIKGGFMQLAPAGTPDLVGYKGGSFIGIECKTTAKESKLSPEQIEFRTHVYRSGAVYIEARHLQDVVDIIGF